MPLKIKILIAKLRSETTIMTPQTLKLVEKQGRSSVDKKLFLAHRIVGPITYRQGFYQCLVCAFPHHLARLSTKCNNGSYRVTPEWNQLLQASRTVTAESDGGGGIVATADSDSAVPWVGARRGAGLSADTDTRGCGRALTRGPAKVAGPRSCQQMFVKRPTRSIKR